MGESQHELMVEIGKAQEALKLSECGWGWPVMDDLDLGWIQMYAMLINDVVQEHFSKLASMRMCCKCFAQVLL
jgi:hypothetical protein